MLIEADQVAYGLRQTISRNDSELQPDMEGVATKRRRCTSSTSCNSAATQLSYISEDSGSPNEGQGSRPLFGLESQEEESQAFYTFRQSNGDVSSGNRLAKAASASSATSSSNHRALPPGALTNRTAFTVGVPANGTRTLLKPPPKATSDNRLDYEKQRALIKAKRLGADRRRSESIVTHRSRESLVPPHRSHTTTCMAQGGSMLEEDDETFQKQAFCGNCTAAVVGSRSSLTNLLHVNERNRCNHNRDANVNASRMRVDGRVLGYHQMNCSPVRAKSIDGLDDSVHFYDSLGPSSTNINERDTEIYMDHNEPGVRLSRTRLNSAPSDDSTERIQNEARLNNDAESGYVRNGPREHSGFFGTVSITLRRHGIAVLAMCNVLLLVVICIGISYAFLIKPPPKIVAPGSDAGNCFNCTDMPFGTTKEHLESGLLLKHDKDQCCFQSSEDMNSWFIKEITGDKTKGAFDYFTGQDFIEIDSKHRIKWKERSNIGPMQLSKDQTAIEVVKPGYYFIFSHVHFLGTDACTDNYLELSHTINRANMVGDRKGHVLVENISKKCQQKDDVTGKEHTSVLETIAQLKNGDHVYVGVKSTDMVNRFNDHSLGIIMIQ